MKRMIYALLTVTVALGCGDDETTAAEPLAEPPTRSGQTGAPNADEAEPETEAQVGPVAEDPTFELRATANGPYAVGEPAVFEIRLTPRGRYHVNQDFPMSIALEGAEEVELPSDDLGNDDAAEFSEETARFEVPFTPSAAGEHRVTAEVDFAVCTPEACLPDRRTLALALPVH